MQSIILSAISVLICLSVHEASHALAAYLCGDSTAKNQGRLTLNPIYHIDPIGFIALVVFHFGWAKPVPINYANLKKPKLYSAIISLAGPVSNFVLAIVLYTVAVLLTLVDSMIAQAVLQFLVTTATISVGLGIFNLIPIPPLDGSHILMPLLSKKTQFNIMKNIQFIQFGMMLMLYFGILNVPLYYLRQHAMNIIFKIVDSILFFI